MAFSDLTAHGHFGFKVRLLLTWPGPGFHTERGGGTGIPPPEILKLSMVIIVLSQVLNNNFVSDCVRSNLRGSKFSWGSMPSDPPSRHTHLCVHECAFAHYYYPATILFPPFPPTHHPVWTSDPLCVIFTPNMNGALIAGNRPISKPIPYHMSTVQATYSSAEFHCSLVGYKNCSTCFLDPKAGYETTPYTSHDTI